MGTKNVSPPLFPYAYALVLPNGGTSVKSPNIVTANPSTGVYTITWTVEPGVPQNDLGWFPTLTLVTSGATTIIAQGIANNVLTVETFVNGVLSNAEFWVKIESIGVNYLASNP